jgi:MarR family transcriptional regulator, 2-MHQ and catechol-resistance regulon repressor
VASGKLQHEIGKRQPFSTLEEEAMLNLLRTSDQIQIHFTRLFREYGLTPSQYNVLRILRGEGKPLPILEVAERTVTVVPGITGLIDRLEQAGMVRREPCYADRRVIFVAITEAALELLARLDEPVRDLQRRLLAHMPRTELKTLIRLVEKARESAAQERA